MSAPHPPAEELRAFAAGAVDDASGALIEGHLATCESCWGVIERADEDGPVARVLRSLPPGRVQAGQTEDGAASGGVAGEPPAELLDHPRYRLLDLIGAGGMGRVWTARHEWMNRVVAVKTIRPDLLRDERAVVRFRREVEAAAALDHPNIVRAFDAERVGDLHVLVMEYVEGVDLARLVRDRGPLPVAEACGYAGQVAAGLAYAHARGFVHRDIKPHNLLRDQTGRVKISDFGLASLVAAPDGPAADPPDGTDFRTGVGDAGTRFGGGCGTPDYIAPEQIRDAGRVDGRADLYSLGCTLYHLLAGQPPFAGGTGYSKVAGHLERQPRGLAEVRPDLPAGLAAVVARMLAKDRADRFGSAADVAAALAPFGPTPESPGVKASPSRRRFLAAGGVGLAAVAAGGWFALRGRPTRPTPVADGRRLGGHAGRVMCVAVSRDGRLAASGGHDRAVRVWSVEEGQTVAVMSGHTGVVNAVAFSPDGTMVASGGYDRADRTIRVWDAASGREVVRCGDGGHPVVRLAFSPDGTRLASGGDDQTVRVWAAGGGRMLHRLEGHDGPVQAVAFTPDGEHVVSAGNDRTVRMWNLADGRESLCLRGHTHVVHDLWVSADGQRLLSGGDDGTVREWDRATGGEVRRLAAQAGVYRVAGLPDRGLLVFVRGGAVWAVRDGAWAERCRLPAGGPAVSDVALDPNRRVVLTGDDSGAVVAWQLPKL